jgi:1,4-alpha-glucan branching enzyme
MADNRADQVLAFARGEYVFVFNFNPVRSYTDYGIQSSPGKHRIVLNTDNPLYGGAGNVDEKLTYFSKSTVKHGALNYLMLYLPSRSALVLRKQKTPKVY